MNRPSLQAIFSLSWQMARREISARYRGSALGFAWSLLTPLAMLLVYGFVFALVLRARWPGLNDELEGWGHGVLILSGIMVHAFLAECLVRAPRQIVGQPNYVKKVVFPLHLIALSQWLAASFNLAINLCVLLAFQTVVFGLPPVSVLLAPLALLPLAAIGLGLMWAVSAISVYFRDLEQVTPLLATMLLFLSPALYPVEQVPEAFRVVLYCNPLTPAIELWRGLAIWGVTPGMGASLLWASAGVLALLGGGWVFKRLRPGFADVL